MTMLTDEKIKELVSETSLFAYWYSHGDLLVQLVHAAIEAAVQQPVAAPVVQPQQEPVGKPHRWNDDGERCLDCGDKDWMADKYCSAAPVVQPDMVMVPREPSVEIRVALQKEAIVPFSKTKHIYRAMIAAAEKEQK